jgi:Circularly permutated YpsA SLOG family
MCDHLRIDFQSDRIYVHRLQIGFTMIERVISGGQTGADQAAWRAARAAGIATGGWMPRGAWTEAGPRPEFADQYGAREHASAEPADRTVANVRDADATLIFTGESPGPGTLLTIAACREAGVPHRVVPLAQRSDETTPARMAAWLAHQPIRTLNVAGDRESEAPGIGALVEAYLAELFRILT